MKNLCFMFSFLVVLAACSEQKSLDEMKEYTGPMAVMKNVQTFYSDSAVVKIVMSAPTQIEQKTGDQSFPDGIAVAFYNEKGVKYSHLSANSGTYNKMSGIFTAIGNVVVIDSIEDKKLTTELLNWSRAERRIYTDKFVTIEIEGEPLQGEGLTAAQDFSTYKILKPRGNIMLESDEEEEEEEE